MLTLPINRFKCVSFYPCCCWLNNSPSWRTIFNHEVTAFISVLHLPSGWEAWEILFCRVEHCRTLRTHNTGPRPFHDFEGNLRVWRKHWRTANWPGSSFPSHTRTDRVTTIPIHCVCVPWPWRMGRWSRAQLRWFSTVVCTGFSLLGISRLDWLDHGFLHFIVLPDMFVAGSTRAPLNQIWGQMLVKVAERAAPRVSNGWKVTWLNCKTMDLNSVPHPATRFLKSRLSHSFRLTCKYHQVSPIFWMICSTWVDDLLPSSLVITNSSTPRYLQGGLVGAPSAVDVRRNTPPDDLNSWSLNVNGWWWW